MPIPRHPTFSIAGLTFCAALTALAILLVATKPASAQQQTDPHGQTGFSAAFTLDNDHILVPALIGGQGPYTFLIDSGAQSNILAGSVAESLHLQPAASVSVNGFGAALTAAEETQPAPISLNGVVQPAQSFLVLDSALQIVRTHQPIAGVLGLPLLQPYVVNLDFAHYTIGGFSPQLPRGAWPTYSGESSVAVKMDATGIALVPATIDGVTGDFQLDTGSNATIIIYSEFAALHPEKFGAPSPEQASPSPASGASLPQLGGSVQMRRMDNATVTIAGFTGTVSPVLVIATTPISAAGKNIAGNIGVGLLKRFDLLIDYPDRILSVAPLVGSGFSESTQAQ